MRDSASSPVPAQGTRTAEALVHLQHVVVDGLRHGFFECSVTCEIVSSGKRQPLVRPRPYKTQGPVPLMFENKSHHTTAQNAVGVENNDRFTHHHSDLTLAGG